MAEAEQQIQSVWTREPARSRRRDQPALSREQIVSEALALLDAEGMEALSMRKLGTRLGAGATSLYTHVANKEELMELITDAVFGELTPPVAGPDGWRPAMLAFSHDLRELMLRHPWLSSVLGEMGLLYLAPNMLRLNESVLSLLEDAGFAPADADLAVTVIFSFVIGLALSEAAAQITIRRSGLDEVDWYRKLMPAAEIAARPYPTLHRRYLNFSEKTAVPDADMSRIRTENFDLQIGRVLDGLDPEFRAGR
ncbi:TetR/AcrR family transcriptional regulator [Nocardia sp. NBC_01503]|uniref:TetR/AcrR family transcriptional regulator n=1 Tax=Nocardia sp. NBC_01503 TaxID=2975997 RepID=UPI002E7C0178|nr:TetR/AcrR family transcriptional regulator [Nocardia sp. NBC_01503]WTL34488.1 TetR/AcrR family transcriptional regulator [Nocardia sp. NBC_01503]